MTNRNFNLIFVLLGLTFIFFCLAVEKGSAQQDTLADVAIIYKGSYPGRFALVEVKLKNEVKIAGFQFEITFGPESNPEILDFHTDSIGVETWIDTVWEDTCTGPEPHGDSCFVVDSVRVHEDPVRYCRIDTVGSLISNFNTVKCRGEVGDTSSPECKWVTVFGMAKQGEPIEENSNYQTLFRLGMDVSCMSDTVDERSVYFYIVPGMLSFLSDPDGELVLFRYHEGMLTVSWSVPGDANADSVVHLGDVVRLVDYLYRDGAPLCIPEAGDANGSCLVELGDIVTLVQYLYRGGPPPLPGCWHGKKEE